MMPRVMLTGTRNKLDHVSAILVEKIFSDALDELDRGDAKYGRHPGPRRAFGALRAELAELQTELEAEDATDETIYKEAVQVIAMGVKLIRDYKNKLVQQERETMQPTLW